MKKSLMTVLTMGLILLAQPTLAAEKVHKKCSEHTEVCLRYMAENLKKRGWIGIEWDKGGTPPVITKVVPKSPAEKAGVEVGDAILAFNGVLTSEEKAVVSAEVKKVMIPGNKITLTVERSGELHNLEVELGRVPDQLLAQWVGYHMLKHHSGGTEEEEQATKP